MRGKDRQKELEADGWIRKSINDEPRLSELVETYKSLGMDVKLEPVDPEMLDQDCDTCMRENPEQFKIINDIFGVCFI